MKPDWDKLVAEFKGHATGVVADVDCTAGGKSLCEKVGVNGYPSIKYGDPNALEDYEGGRDFAALQKFAQENLKPVCSPTNIDLCDDEKKKQIEELMALSDEDLAKQIKEKETEMDKAERKFKKRVEKLQAKYEEYNKEKDATIAEIKAGGLGLKKAVKAAKKSKEEL